MVASKGRCGPALSRAMGLGRISLVILVVTICVVSVTGNHSHAASFPSPWAQDEVKQAIAAGLVPADMLGDYTKPITRAEFCRLLIIVMEKAAGTSMEEWLRAHMQRTDFDFTVSPFSDTLDRNVLAACYLNIIQGRDENHFDPDGNVTREEAARSLSATLLYWYAADLPYGPDEPYTDYSQMDPLTQWHVANLKRAGIMVGVGNNLFDPKGTLTREQAYVAILRLRNILPFPGGHTSTRPALEHPKVRVCFEDTQVEFEGADQYGCALVPSSYVSAAMGAKVDHDNLTGRITITRGDDTLLLVLASYEASVNGEAVTLEVPPRLLDGELMLPFRFICEALGMWVEWWNDDLCIRVYSSPPTSPLMANLMNKGLATGEDGWLYYATYDGIYRSRIDGSESEKIADTEASHLNKRGDWLVFSPHHYSYSSNNEYSGSPWIFRVPVDGGEPQEVAHVEAQQVTVLGDYVYYSGIDFETFEKSIYRVRLDGGEPEPVVRNVVSRFYIDGDWVYYTGKGLYRAKADGSAVEKISDFLVHTYLVVHDGWVYCVRYDDGCLYRIRTDGSDVQRLFGDYRCQGLNVAGGWVYFATEASGTDDPDRSVSLAIRRMRLDGSEVRVVATLDEDAQCWAICVQEGWVFFETTSPSKTVPYGVAYTLYRMRTDGSGLEVISKSE